MISCSHWGMFDWAGFEGRELFPTASGWLIGGKEPSKYIAPDHDPA